MKNYDPLKLSVITLEVVCAVTKGWEGGFENFIYIWHARIIELYSMIKWSII